MVDMVEKVARAICLATIEHPIEALGHEPLPAEGLERAVENLAVKFLPEAKAAIRAMIEGLEPVAWRYDMNATYPRFYSSDRYDDMAHAWAEQPLYDLSQLKEAVK